MSELNHHNHHHYPPNQHHYISPHTVKLRSPSKECPMNVIVYKNQPHQNGFYEQPNLPPAAAAYHPQTLMHRSATQNHLSNSTTPNKDSNSLHNWPNKSNWLSASGRLSSMSFYSMLSSSLSNLSISAFNYKLEFGKISCSSIPLSLSLSLIYCAVYLF